MYIYDCDYYGCTYVYGYLYAFAHFRGLIIVINPSRVILYIISYIHIIYMYLYICLYICIYICI